jgi:hypothetical protein
MPPPTNNAAAIDLTQSDNDSDDDDVLLVDFVDLSHEAKPRSNDFQSSDHDKKSDSSKKRCPLTEPENTGPKRRKRGKETGEDPSANEGKNFSAFKKKIKEELECCIMQDLPEDPVFAADGRLYDRAGIEQYFEFSKTKKSPYMGKDMKNKKLIPSLQYGKILEVLRGLCDDNRGTANQRKDRKALMRVLTENLICPETKKLPFNPVIDEDGLVYDSSAQDGIPSVQHKNLILASIDNDMIDDRRLVEDWDKKLAEKKQADSLMAKAEKGDVGAMIEVAQNFESGSNGFFKDLKEAFKWYDKARSNGSVLGMASVGEMLCEGGKGVVRKNRSLGKEYISAAASLGSDFALYQQGMMWADGLYGCPRNPKLAIVLLEKCLSHKCTYQDMSRAFKNIARNKLNDLRRAETNPSTKT